MTTNQRLCCAATAIFMVAIFHPSAGAATTLTNGLGHFGTISPSGDFDSWTFTANAGDQVVLSVAKLSTTNGFEPVVDLRGPTGATLASTYAGNYHNTGELSWGVTNSGVFTVLVYDASDFYDGYIGTGTYMLYFAKMPGTFVVPSGDEGGLLTNGGNHDGAIPLGDLDIWSFTADAGDTVTLNIAYVNGFNSFTPLVRLYGPDGVPGATSFNVIGGPIPTGGTWTVLVSDGDYSYDGHDGTGAYRL